MTIMRRLIALAAVAAMLFSPSARAFERLAKPESGTLLTRVNGHHGWGGCRGRGCWHHHRYARGFYGNGFALMYYVHNYPRGISATFGAPRPCFCGSRW
jgi:hypothetical protein